MGRETSREKGTLKRTVQTNPDIAKMRNHLIWSTLGLILAGWIILIDTGLIFQGKRNLVEYNSILIKRATGMVVGFGLSIILWQASPNFLRRIAPWVALISLVLLALVFTPLGETNRGCRGWINLCGMNFQPLEAAKIGTVWFLAAVLARSGPLRKAPLEEFIGPAILLIIAVTLVGLQNEVSGMLFLIFIIFAMAILSGISRIQGLWLFGAAAIVIALVAAFWPEKLMDRIMPVINPTADLSNVSYQTAQSLGAIIHGGFWGVGPGNSIAMYSLPDHTTDFIFAIICEQYGTIGGLTIIILFVVFLRAAFAIALSQQDNFKLYLGMGLAMVVALEATINLGVATNMLPVTGVPLPFVSAGGSNMIMNFAMLGLLFNLSKYSGTTAEKESISPSKTFSIVSQPSGSETLRKTGTYSSARVSKKTSSFRTANYRTRNSSIIRGSTDWPNPKDVDELFSKRKRTDW